MSIVEGRNPAYPACPACPERAEGNKRSASKGGKLAFTAFIRTTFPPGFKLSFRLRFQLRRDELRSLRPCERQLLPFSKELLFTGFRVLPFTPTSILPHRQGEEE